MVQYVLGLDKTIQQACNAYYDDILVDLTQVSAARVEDHLQRYGLIARPPEEAGRHNGPGFSCEKSQRSVGLETANANRRRDLAKNDKEGVVLDVWQVNKPFPGGRMAEGQRRVSRTGRARLTGGTRR